MRWFSAFAASVRIAALVLVGACAGCQSNSDRDLIARDRRMQENQIYALQDYVKQYQQLVCQYRAENASLRSQLAEGSAVVEAAPAERSPMPPAGISAPAKSAPEFQTPIPPAVKEPASPPPAAAPPATTPESTPKNDSLLVPPLKSTRSGRTPRYRDQSSNSGSSVNASTNLLLASYDQSTGTSPTAETAAKTDWPPTNNQVSRGDSIKRASANSKFAARIFGEVVANESGGPRLMVDVVPSAASGGTESFEGKLSLMLLAEGANGRKRNLGRWDFTRDDVHAARNKGENEQALRFFIELPANISVNGETQLWARLMPLEGGKSLVHAAIDLSGPGAFSSVAAAARHESKVEAEPPIQTTSSEEVAPKTSVGEDAVATAGYETDLPQEQESFDSVATALNESSWSIATPGKPANLPVEASNAAGHGGWRLSSEPMPVDVAATAVQAGGAVEKSSDFKLPVLGSLTEIQSARTEEPSVSAVPMAGVRPSWSSQRSSGVSERTAARPSWSSKR